MSADVGEGWKVAGRRKGAARRVKTSKEAPACLEQVDTRRVLQRIRETMSELRCEDVWQEWKAQLLTGKSREDEDVTNHTARDGESGTKSQLGCVCYGLGPFSSCVSARYQLAMLLLLLDTLQIPPKDCSVYDPIFSSAEKEVLKELDLTVLTENEEGKRLVTGPTLFYMMHCGKALYNNLLWRNWSREALPFFTIIGNSFSGIQDRMVAREFRRDYAFIAQAVAVCEERPLPCPPRLLDVFNDTAVMTFPASNLDRLPQSTWAEPPEPQYQHCPDLEIIIRGGSQPDASAVPGPS